MRAVSENAFPQGSTTSSATIPVNDEVSVWLTEPVQWSVSDRPRLRHGCVRQLTMAPLSFASLYNMVFRLFTIRRVVRASVWMLSTRNDHSGSSSRAAVSA